MKLLMKIVTVKEYVTYFRLVVCMAKCCIVMNGWFVASAGVTRRLGSKSNKLANSCTNCTMSN